MAPWLELIRQDNYVGYITAFTQSVWVKTGVQELLRACCARISTSRFQGSSERQLLSDQNHDPLKTFDSTLPCGVQEAKVQVLLMVEVLRDLDMDNKGGHTAAADMAYLYAMTQVWFTVERNYKVPLLIQCIFMMHRVHS